MGIHGGLNGCRESIFYLLKKDYIPKTGCKIRDSRQHGI